VYILRRYYLVSTDYFISHTFYRYVIHIMSSRGYKRVFNNSVLF